MKLKARYVWSHLAFVCVCLCVCVAESLISHSAPRKVVHQELRGLRFLQATEVGHILLFQRYL